MAHPETRTLAGEKPLGPAARAWLVVNAAVTILLFYLTAVVFIAGFGALALLLLLVAIGAARFGAAAIITRLMQPPLRLMGVLGRRLWLWSSPDYRLALTARDAPGLFEIARELSRRSGVAPPSEISIEMHANAWVRLHGYRRGAGRTTLGIGFDLLAGLTVSEVEAVLAHELAHARLVRRGFSRWLKRGLARLGQISSELAAYAAVQRQANSPSDLADATAGVFDALTRRAARLVATYSRQDEFEADHGAAELCGGAAIRSSLMRLDVLSDVVSSLPWSERLARLQPGEAFTAWLVSELGAPDRGGTHLALRHAVDPYSTHPALSDRLAALPADDAPLRDARPGIALLADPDRVASQLAREIQRVALVEEQRDTKRLARDTRKFCRAEGMTAGPFIGTILLVFGVILALISLSDEFPLDLTITAVVMLAIGVLLFRYRYRDTRRLPVPGFGTLLNPRPATETEEQLHAAEEKLVAEFRAFAAQEPTDRARVAMLIGASYAALAQRDYLRAHVAGRLALELKPKSVEATIGYAIAAAGLGNVQQMSTRIGYLRRKIGLRTPALKWGTAWALSLLGDWSCEGLLQQLHERDPGVATYASLLALAQMHRAKLQSATRNAERGVALDPANLRGVYLLAQILLLSGRTADAAARLDPLADQIRSDATATFLMVRLRLMQRDTAGALQWADVVKGLDGEEGYLVALGQAFGAARQAEPAAAFFQQAAGAGFGPEANVGLSMVALLRGDRMGARGYLLAALKFEGAKFTPGLTLGAMFHEILGRLNGLAEQRLDCTAWIATVPAGTAALSGRSILVCAQSEVAARLYLETIVTAMQGSKSEPAADLARASWRLAPKEQQPDRPVPPGVHSVIG